MAGLPGTALVMDVASGRLLAAHRIDFAAKVLARPGSVAKPFVLEALREHSAGGVRVVCNGRLQIAGRPFDCTHVPVNGPLDAHRALAYSCNNWFAQASRSLSAADLQQEFLRSGFASATGLQAGEAVGSVALAADDDAKRLQALGEAGVKITPLELAAAYRKLARRTATNPAIADDLAAAAAFGTAQLAQPLGAEVAAKTGTTSEGAWLAGWIPARNPRAVVVVYLPGGSGGADAAPVARQVFTALMEADPRGVTVESAALPFEEYVVGVVAGEAGSMRNAESLKAMAVTARTWAAAMRGRHRAEGFDFCATTHCQAYRPAEITAAAVEAVRATAGEMLWFGGKPAFTFYSRDCGGVTEAGERVWPDLKAPYLTQHRDPWCGNGGRNEWRAELEKAAVERALRAERLPLRGPLQNVHVLSRTPSGRVDQLSLGAGVVHGAEFRFAVGRQMGWNLVRSDAFEITDTGDRLLLRGTGGGHGIGLCQLGAAHMGEQRKDYREILAFYYPGTVLSRSAKGLAWKILTGERVQVETAQVERDRALVQRADALANQAEQRTGLHFRQRPTVRIYPDAATFRDGAAEPGWVAGSTRAGTIRMQPGAGEAVLRHELLHELIEQNAAAELPVWFREGVVLYLENPANAGAKAAGGSIARAQTRAQMAAAYEDARARVQELARQHGRAAVLAWISSGLPAGLRGPATPTR